MYCQDNVFLENRHRGPGTRHGGGQFATEAQGGQSQAWPQKVEHLSAKMQKFH